MDSYCTFLQFVLQEIYVELKRGVDHMTQPLTGKQAKANSNLPSHWSVWPELKQKIFQHFNKKQQ